MQILLTFHQATLVMGQLNYQEKSGRIKKSTPTHSSSQGDYAGVFIG